MSQHSPAKQGSYLYPPILHTAEETIVFYESVEIPDKVCGQVDYTYITKWQEVTDYLPEQMWVYVIGPQREADGQDVSDTAKSEYLAEWHERLVARPSWLDPRDVRVGAKVIGLACAKKSLPEEERHLIDSHEVEMTTGITTVREVNLGLGLAYFGGSICEPATYRDNTAGELLQIRALLEGLDENVNNTRDHLDGVVRYVGRQLVDLF